MVPEGPNQAFRRGSDNSGVWAYFCLRAGEQAACGMGGGA